MKNRRLVFSTMATFLLLPYLVVPAGATEPESFVARKSETKGELAVVSTRGSSVLMTAKSLVLDLHVGEGAKTGLHVISLYDSETGMFWWTYQRTGSQDPVDRLADFRRRFSLLVTDREILGLELATPPPQMWLLRSSLKVESQEDGERRVFAALGKRREDIRNGTDEVLHEVNLWSHFPTEFFYHPYQAMPELEVEVSSIERHESTWEIAITGREGRRARIVLDEALDLVQAEELP